MDLQTTDQKFMFAEKITCQASVLCLKANACIYLTTWTFEISSVKNVGTIKLFKITILKYSLQGDSRNKTVFGSISLYEMFVLTIIKSLFLLSVLLKNKVDRLQTT